MSEGEIFVCHQCGIQYTNEENVTGACRYHPNPSESRGRYQCCGQSQPCESNKHRPEMHCDYPYAKFFSVAWGIMNYCDTTEEWGSIEENDDGGEGETQTAYVAQLLRWSSRGQSLANPLLLVKLGRLYTGGSYWFKTYSEKALDEIGKAGKELIFRSSESQEEYSLARWVINDSQVVGIHIECKVRSSALPTSKLISMTAFPLKVGEVVTLSKGGIQEYKPENEYVLPKSASLGPTLPSVVPRAARSNFPNQGNLNAKLKVIRPIESTQNRQKADGFVAELCLINMNKSDPILIEDATCEWRLVGSPDWQPVTSFDIPTPFTCAPYGPTSIPFAITISCEDKLVRWQDKSWVGRKQPIRFRITFFDILGSKISQVMEYAFTPYKLSEPPANALLHLHADDPNIWERYSVSVEAESGSVFKVGYNSFDEKKLRALVFKAESQGETEQFLGEGGSAPNWEWKAWGLVDLSCRRVYAVKVVISTPVSRSLGYCLIDTYGGKDETRPNKPAREKAVLPDCQTELKEDLVQDDDFDDKAEPKQPSAEEASQVTLSQMNDSLRTIAESMQKLEKMDQSINRLADVLEGFMRVVAQSKQ